MCSPGIVYPEEITFMTEALNVYCNANGIERGTPDYDDAAQQVLTLFNMGCRSKDEIVAMLEPRQPSDRMKPGMPVSHQAFPAVRRLGGGIDNCYGASRSLPYVIHIAE